MRAAIYCRISRDRAGEALGVARQEQDCRALAERRGWEVVEVLVDNDRSAYSGRPRPGYQTLLCLLKDGHIDVVVAWHPDRLHRSPRELEDFIDLLDAAGATVETIQTGIIDLSTPSGRMTARIVGSVARHESEHKSARLRRKALQLAQAGEVGGGGTRPFGYETDLVTVNEAEAAHIRAAVDRILAGGTLRGVMRDWNANGVRPVAAERWAPNTLKRMLLRPRLAGLREHHGVVVAEAVWPAIIDVETHERLVAAIGARTHTRGPNRTYLLTGGVGRCGPCGAPLYARPKADGRRCYVCASDHGGCGKIRCLADPLEGYVVDMMLDRAAEGRFADLDAVPGGRATAMAEIADLRARKDQLAADHYVTGDLSDARSFRAASDALDGRLASARARLAAIDEATAAAEARASAMTLTGRWEAMSVEDRRATVALLVDEVVVAPAVKGRNFFDPGRVTVRWVG